jgi:hypothetical protein
VRVFQARLKLKPVGRAGECGSVVVQSMKTCVQSPSRAEQNKTKRPTGKKYSGDFR